MKTLNAASFLFVLAFTSELFAEDLETFEKKTGGEERCLHDSGDEVKDFRWIEAPAGRFFSSFTFEPEGPIRSWAGGDIGCTIRDKKTESIIVTLHGAQVPVEVTTAYYTLAHADCGSGVGRTAAHIAANESARAVCVAKGKTALK